MDWGDHTPGPWRDGGWDNFDEDFEPARTVLGPPVLEMKNSLLICVYGDSASARNWDEAETDARVKADARLISKAYLIPRLEAALADEARHAHNAHLQYTLANRPEDCGAKPCREFTTLLAELRAE